MTVVTRSYLGYVFLFGAIFGYASLSSTLSHGHIVRDPAITWWAWLPMAMVGLLFLALRNRQLADSGGKRLLILADLLVIAGELLLLRFVPDYFGLVKGGIVVLIAAIYLSVYQVLLRRGTFVAQDAPAPTAQRRA